MPNSTLPPDNYLGDPERTTGEFQDQINNLQNWVNALQAELSNLTSTTVREGAVRQVNGGDGPLRANIGTGDTVQFGRVTDAQTPGDGDFDSSQLGYWELSFQPTSSVGSIDSGQTVMATRVGRRVTITLLEDELTHSLGDTILSGQDIPSWGTPQNNISQQVSSDVDREATVTITSTSRIQVNYRDHAGSAYSDSGTGSAFSFSYNV